MSEEEKDKVPQDDQLGEDEDSDFDEDMYFVDEDSKGKHWVTFLEI